MSFHYALPGQTILFTASDLDTDQHNDTTPKRTPSKDVLHSRTGNLHYSASPRRALAGSRTSPGWSMDGGHIMFQDDDNDEMRAMQERNRKVLVKSLGGSNCSDAPPRRSTVSRLISKVKRVGSRTSSGDAFGDMAQSFDTMVEGENGGNSSGGKLSKKLSSAGSEVRETLRGVGDARGKYDRSLQGHGGASGFESPCLGICVLGCMLACLAATHDRCANRCQWQTLAPSEHSRPAIARIVHLKCCSLCPSTASALPPPLTRVRVICLICRAPDWGLLVQASPGGGWG